jgi:hypothetical protein
MKTSCIIFFAFLSSLGLLAQEDFFSNPAYYQNRASLNIIPEIEIGFAINEFQEKMDKGVLLGKGISIFYRLKNRPIDIGLRFGDFSYDHVKRIYDGNRQKTKNKIWNWYSAFRFEPITKLPFQPYFEGSLGLNHYKTKTYTKQIGAQLLALIFNSDESVRFDEANLHSDWATNYGGAIGCYFYLNKNHNSAIDVQVGYRSGNTAKFYVERGISIQEEPLDNYEEREGAMSMVSLKLGLSFFGFSTY